MIRKIFKSVRNDYFKNFRRTAIFSPTSEIIISGFGILFLIFTLIDISFWSLGNSHKKIFRFLADIVFFNSTHAAFTLVLLYYVPEFQNWRKSTKSFFKSFNYDILSGFVLLSLIGIFGGYAKKFGLNNALISIPFFLFINKFIFIFLESNHALGQQYGLSLLINRSSEHKVFNSVVEQREKFIFKTFKMTFFVLLLVNILIYEEGFPLIDLQKIISSLQMLVAVVLILNCFFYHQDIIFRKVAYLARNLTFLFVFESDIAKFAFFANHGIEYVILTSAIIQNSSADQNQKTKIKKMLLVFSLLWIAATIPSYFLFKKYVSKDIMYVTLFVINVGAMFHYWIDRLMFRMRNETTRRLISPLLLNTLNKK